MQTERGRLAARRQQQAMAWMWERIDAGLKQSFRMHPQVRDLLPKVTEEVRCEQLSASIAARKLLAAFQHQN
jgi:LAO/AO transport system kinase